MSVATAVARLRQLAAALPRPGYDWEERPRFDRPATPERVAEIEQAAGFVLPRALHEFLRETSAVVAMSMHNPIWLGGIDQLIEGDDLPRAVAGEPAIAIATDGGGNAFLLSASGAVSFWDHETDKTKVVAGSFNAFLTQVVEDWAAYINGPAG